MGNSKSTPSYPRRPVSSESESVRRRTKISRPHEDFLQNFVTDSFPGCQYPHDYRGPIRFNDVHGVNVTVSHGGKVASRTNSFCYAIAFTSRSVEVEERVQLRLRRIDSGWSGVMRFGFTTRDPSSMTPGSLPRYACPDLTERGGYWAKALPVEFAKQRNVLTFYVTNSGCVFFAINNQHQGMILDGVDTSTPLWGLFDIYGNTTSLEFVDRRFVEEVESISPRESLGLEIGLPEGPVQLPSNMLHSAKIRLQVNDPITPICFSATMGNGLKGRNRTHLTTKHSFVESTVAFTNTALQPGQTAYFYCAEASTVMSPLIGLTSFGIGVTTCDPTSIPIHELPFDAMLLMDRPEYWVFYQDFEVPEQGEYFALCVEKGGFLSYNRSRVGKSVLFHIDNSQPLYIILDLCGKVTSVAIIGMSTEPGHPDEDLSTLSEGRILLSMLNSDSPSDSLEFLRASQLLGRRALLEDDHDIPSTSNSRNAEIEMPDSSNVPTTSSSHDLDTHEAPMPSGVYPHEPPSQGVSTSTMVAVAAPIVASAISWIGQRVVDSMGSNEVPASEESNIRELSSDDEGHEEIFRDALDEPDSSSSSEDSTLENALRNNVSLLETLNGDLEEILRPITLLEFPFEGAVGGSSPPARNEGNKSSSSKATSMTPLKETSKSEEKDSNTTESGKECVICFDNIVDAVIYSCGHACLCYECGIRLKKSPQRSCPICRAKVKDVIRMYPA